MKRYTQIQLFISILNIYILSNLMGSSQGLIHNQSNQDLVYALHHDKYISTEDILKQIISLDILKAGLPEVTNPNETDKKEEPAKNEEKIEFVYKVEPGRITTEGLKDVDFDKVKYLTILAASDKKLIISTPVSNEKNLMVKVRPDLSVKDLSEQQFKQLKKFTEGKYTKQVETCVVCKDKNVSQLLIYEDQMPCNGCKKDFKDIWVCRMYPHKHSFCKECNASKGKPKGSEQ